MDTSLQINIVTYNCKSIKRSVDQIRELCKDNDIIALQETWLLPHDLDYLSSIDKDFSSCGTSAVDTSAGILRGRPYGGVALLWRKNIFPRVQQIDCNNARIVGVRVDGMSGRSALFFSVYMTTNCIDNLPDFTSCLADLGTRMREPRRVEVRRHQRTKAFVVLLALSSYLNLASSSPTAVWPRFTKRNVQALARDGLLRTSGSNLYDYKRSISTLAKNGQLPTFRAPEDNTEDVDSDQNVQKRNLAAIARLKSYKRNIGSMMRNGYRTGKRDYDDKRNIASLARNGYFKIDQDNFHKRENALEDEYYYPFYQNSIPPLSEVDFPIDYNELYDLQQSMHPDLLPPLSEIYDKRNVAALLRQDAYNMIRNTPNYHPIPTPNNNEEEFDQVDKRTNIGLPNHGLFRTINPDTQNKRYIFSIPEPANDPNFPEYDAVYEAQEKKSVGSIPMTRISELGNISIIPKVSQKPIQTTPTYRRRQYLLTRTRPAEAEADQ